MSFNSQVVLNDPTNAGGASDAILVDDLYATLDQWSRYVAGAGTLTVQLNIVQTAVGREDGGPTTSYFDGTSNGLNVFASSALYELTNGQHVNGSTSDITIDVSPSYFQYLDLSQPLGYFSTPAANKYDPVVVFLHEMMHGFGMDSDRSQTGVLPAGAESEFDTFTQVNPDGSDYYIGPNGEAAYGGPIRLTTSSTAGENYSHFGNTISDFNQSPSTVQDPLTLDLLNGIVFFFDYRYQISPIDLGVLKDLGYKVLNPAISDTDANGDGGSDVLLQQSGGIIDWIVSNGTYTSYNPIGAAPGYTFVGSGDFNDDGTSDVLLQSSGGSLVDWMLHNGQYSSYGSIGNASVSGYNKVGIGDFNGDGTSDLLLENGSGIMIDWIIKNGAYSSYNGIGGTSGYGVIGTGDFNGDGTSDVLLQNGGGSIIDWIMQNGRYSSYGSIGNASVSGYGVVGTGDFNGDGTTDLLLENGAGNLIDWVMKNGIYASYNQIGGTAGYGVAGTGDYNGDGTSDILLQNAGGNVIDWIMNNGKYAGWNEVGGAGSYAVVKTSTEFVDTTIEAAEGSFV